MAGGMYAYYAGNAQISATEHFQRKPFDYVCGTNKPSRSEFEHGQRDR